MGKSRKEFENAIVWLSSSEDEDEVIKHLTYIVKGFSSHMYKETILSNPYYKDLFLDVREDVMDNLDNLEKSLLDEIYSIEKSLSGSGKQISEKLKDLKRDCELLIDEIEAKREELQSFL